MLASCEQSEPDQTLTLCLMWSRTANRTFSRSSSDDIRTPPLQFLYFLSRSKAKRRHSPECDKNLIHFVIVYNMADEEDARAPRYDGEDVSPTTERELKGWYSTGLAAEIFAVCGVGE